MSRLEKMADSLGRYCAVLQGAALAADAEDMPRAFSMLVWVEKRLWRVQGLIINKIYGPCPF